jgi:hypothetical protein
VAQQPTHLLVVILQIRIATRILGAGFDPDLVTADVAGRYGGERSEALRCLLYLFERYEAIPLIGAG